MTKITTNNLPGYNSGSNRFHYPVMWAKLYNKELIQFKKLGDNKYSLSVNLKKDNPLLKYPKQYKYLKVKTKHNNYFVFLIDSIKVKKQITITNTNTLTDTSVTELNNNTNISNVSNVTTTNNTVSNINNVNNVNNVSALLYPGRLVTRLPGGGVCVGCETYGLIQYVVVFPSTIPLYSDEDPFMIEGADIFFL